MKIFFLLGVVLTAGFLTGCAHLPMAASPVNVLSPAEHVTLGNTYLLQKENDLATRQYDAALRISKAYVPALVALGNMAFENKDLKKARRYFERAQKASPKDAAVVNNLAMVRLAEGKDLKGVAVMVESALEGAGTATPYLWDTLANIAIHEGRYDDAKNALNKAAAVAPAQDPDFQKHLQESQAKLTAALNK